MTELFRIAAENAIGVEYANVPHNKSLSVANGDNCFIVMDYSLIEGGAVERVHAAHELGHCIRGAFYNPYALIDVRGRHEVKADRWAIRRLIPPDKLRAAISAGYSEMWELSDYFRVTQEFMTKAATYYANIGEIPL